MEREKTYWFMSYAKRKIGTVAGHGEVVLGGTDPIGVHSFGQHVYENQGVHPLTMVQMWNKKQLEQEQNGEPVYRFCLISFQLVVQGCEFDEGTTEV